MPIYTPYFIFLGLSALLFIITLLVKLNTKHSSRRSDAIIWGVMGTVIVYYLVRFIFGWRISNWYAEAFLILGICITLDIFILVKYRYSQQVRIVYYCLRITGIIGPIILYFMSLGIIFITLGFSKSLACYVVPVDTTYGEQWVYKNLYVYQGRCKLGGSELVFKKKFLFFEKKLITMGGNTIFYSSDNSVPLTGYIQRKADCIYISGHQYANDTHDTNYYIKITVLDKNRLKIEDVLYNKNNKDKQEESFQVQYIKL